MREDRTNHMLPNAKSSLAPNQCCILKVRYSPITWLQKVLPAVEREIYISSLSVSDKNKAVDANTSITKDFAFHKTKVFAVAMIIQACLLLLACFPLPHTPEL